MGDQVAKSPPYLEWHGQQWRVVVKIPRDLWPILGRTRFKKGLGTSDLVTANETKHTVIGMFKGIIRQARKAHTSNDLLEAEALQLRLKQYLHDDSFREHVETLAIQIADKHGGQKAADFAEVARGLATPLDYHADAFVAFKATYRHKTEGDFRRVLGWLRKWLTDNHRSPLIEYVSRKDAGRFMSEFLIVGRGRDKANAYLGFLREYWKWLREKGHYADEDPWAGNPLPATPRINRDAEPDGGKRPYTDAELAKLLYGPVEHRIKLPPRRYMGDLMHIAALSGMRLEEICQLRLADCGGGNFTVRWGKSVNAKRIVPIHSALVATIARLAADRLPNAYLIDGLPDAPKSRDSRSDPASKAFTRYRRKMRVDERPNNKAKSNVDFHSFRRWFIKSARDRYEAGNASFSPWTIADVVGHDDDDIKELLKLTMQHYPGPSAEAARRAVVESVKLPSRPPEGDTYYDH